MRRRFETNQSSEKASTISDIPSNKLNSSSSSTIVLLCCLIAFRILNALIIQTWFVPDEFWQGPEVAHQLTFGYGFLTWEWKEGLRGFTYPLLFASAFQALKFLGIDSRNAIVLVPRLLQAVLAGFGDFFVFKLSGKLFGRESAKWSLLCNSLSWFTFYCITRTLTNSAETILTTVALYYWLWETKAPKDSTSNLFLSLIFAAISCLVRPTSAIIWIPLTVYSIVYTHKMFSFIFLNVLPVGCVAILWSLCVDSWFYGKLTIVQFNFVMFNVVKDLGTFYGTHPWHWYFSQGFPVIIFTHLPFFLAGVYCSNAHQKLPALLVLWTVTLYSFLGHKEFRFILPILPLCMCYCGHYLSLLASKSTQCKMKKSHKYSWSIVAILFLCVTNIPVALYTSIVHQRGVMDAMDYVYSKADKEKSSVMFLMPCHSTPYYSYVHANITMQFLACPPSEEPGYVDEADKFFLDPHDWLESKFVKNSGADTIRHLPSQIVFFDVLQEKIQAFLQVHKYGECARYFHSHFPEGRIGREVVIYCHDELDSSL